MSEEQLTPQMGRLIDAAKAAAQVGPTLPKAEGVALLTSAHAVYVGRACWDVLVPRASAADVALAAARRAGDEQVLVAAVAVAGDASETIPLSPASSRSLAGIDPDLPIVTKQRGRWVVLPLSRLLPAP